MSVDTLDVSLFHHLRYNHVPAVPVCLIDTAKAAIAAVNMGDWDDEIAMPEGFDNEYLTARAIIEGLHLEGYLELEEDY